jgi:hypothetical protein
LEVLKNKIKEFFTFYCTNLEKLALLLCFSLFFVKIRLFPNFPHLPSFFLLLKNYALFSNQKLTFFCANACNAQTFASQKQKVPDICERNGENGERAKSL